MLQHHQQPLRARANSRLCAQLQAQLLRLGVLGRLAPLVGGARTASMVQRQLSVQLLLLLASHPECLLAPQAMAGTHQPAPPQQQQHAAQQDAQQHPQHQQQQGQSAASGAYPSLPSGPGSEDDAVLGIPVPGAAAARPAAPGAVLGLHQQRQQQQQQQQRQRGLLDGCVPSLLGDLQRLLLQPSQAPSLQLQVRLLPLTLCCLRPCATLSAG
jgi:hypothetical protein